MPPSPRGFVELNARAERHVLEAAGVKSSVVDQRRDQRLVGGGHGVVAQRAGRDPFQRRVLAGLGEALPAPADVRAAISRWKSS